MPVKLCNRLSVFTYGFSFKKKGGPAFQQVRLPNSMSVLFCPARSRGVGGQQFFHPALTGPRQPWSLLQDPKQIPIRVQAILFRRFDEAVDDGAALGVQGGIGEEEVLAANDEAGCSALCTNSPPPHTTRRQAHP